MVQDHDSILITNLNIVRITNLEIQVSPERRCSSHTFRYGYLVTTSSQSPVPPSTAPSTRVGPPASGVTDFHDLTGGVYKARERIHRGVADPRLLATPTS